MDRETFASEINRLKSVYGERYYPTERVAMMYEQLREVHPTHLSKTISRVICDQMNPPTLSKLKETLVLVRQEYQLEDPNEKLRVTLGSGKFNACPKCYGMGVVSIRKLSEGLRYTYARICSCSAGIEALRLPENRLLKRWDGDRDVVAHYQPEFDAPIFNPQNPFTKEIGT